MKTLGRRNGHRAAKRQENVQKRAHRRKENGHRAGKQPENIQKHTNSNEEMDIQRRKHQKIAQNKQIEQSADFGDIHPNIIKSKVFAF